MTKQEIKKILKEALNYLKNKKTYDENPCETSEDDVNHMLQEDWNIMLVFNKQKSKKSPWGGFFAMSIVLDFSNYRAILWLAWGHYPVSQVNIASWGNKWGDKKELPDNYEKVLGLIRNNPNIIKSQIAKELHIGKSMVDKAIESLSKIKTD